MRTKSYLAGAAAAAGLVSLLFTSYPSRVYADDIYERPDGVEKLKAHGVLVLDLPPDRESVHWVRLEKTGDGNPGESIGGCIPKCRVEYSSPEERGRLMVSSSVSSPALSLLQVFLNSEDKMCRSLVGRPKVSRSLQ